MENSHIDYPVGSAEAVNYSQLICETLELLLTSRDSELFIKAKLRGKKKKKTYLNMPKKVKIGKIIGFFSFHVIGLFVGFSMLDLLSPSR